MAAIKKIRTRASSCCMSSSLSCGSPRLASDDRRLVDREGDAAAVVAAAGSSPSSQAAESDCSS